MGCGREQEFCEYKVLIFTKIAAWKGASHGFETLLS